MTRRQVRLLGVGVALGLALLLWWWDPMSNAPRHPLPAPGPPTAGSYSDDLVLRDVEPLTRSAPPAAANCQPHDLLACNAGDVFWFDSCGNATELFENCEARGCEDARCVEPEAPPPNECGRTSAYGECTGSVAQACVQGRLVSVDCASHRQRCVMTSEGAACLPQDYKNGCQGDEPARCERDKLKLCVDGVFRTIDCAARHAHCVERGALTQCELDPTLPLPPLALGSGELCDNKDNDADGVVDEGDVCAEVPLVAFVPESADLANLELRMQNELAILNRVYDPTKFRWARTVKASSTYRKFDPKDMEAAADALSQSESAFNQSRANQASSQASSNGLDFYIPVLYTEDLKMRPPKSGMSTLPNGHCGAVRLSDQPSPVSGLIVLSESRQPETLAHEMGHYLGLCHTHEQLGHFVVATDGLDTCQRTGDAVCDTPTDPGPSACTQAEGCFLMCRDSSRPDAFNIMSYYIGCRRALSPDQLAIVAQNLELRRGWFRCQDPHACRCDPTLKLACPGEMSCRPSGAAEAPWYCQLDGASLPGTSCEDSALCSRRSFCAGSAQAGNRCIRPCNEEPGCSCIDVGLAVSVCRQDLGL